MTRHQHRRTVGAALLLTLGFSSVLSGCGKNNGGAGGNVTANNGPAITEADSRQFADTMLRAMRAHDTTAMSNLLDVNALMTTSVQGLGLSDREVQGVVEGAKQSLNSPTGLIMQLADIVANGGSCDLLRIVDVDGRKRARVRLVQANDEGLNYVDFVLGRSDSGQVLAQDMYVFYSGELLTQTVRRMAISFTASQNRGLLARLTGTESDYLKHSNDIKSMLQDLAAKQASHAMQTYNSLPESLKQDKTFKLMQVRIAQQMGDAEYQRAMQEIISAYPNDPCVDLISIDYFLLKKQYDESLARVDKLDKAVGGDPYLQLMRASGNILAKRYDQAQQDAQKAVQQMPDSKTAAKTLLTLYLVNRKYDQVPDLLHAMQTRLHESMENISTLPGYAEFAQSPQYQKWRQMQK